MCCGDSHRANAKYIAIFQIVCCCIIGLFLGVLAFGSKSEYDGIDHETVGVLLATILVVLILAIILLVGVREESVTKCGIWFYTNAVALGLSIILSILLAIATQDLTLLTKELLGTILNIYFLYIVRSYMEELREKKRFAREGQAVAFNTV